MNRCASIVQAVGGEGGRGGERQTGQFTNEVVIRDPHALHANRTGQLELVFCRPIAIRLGGVRMHVYKHHTV